MFRQYLSLVTLILFAAFAFGDNAVAPVSGQAGSITATDLYWVSFGGDHNGDPYFLMQIDSAGNVIKAPKAILACNRINACTRAGATALSKNGVAKLNYWVFGGDVLFRALIDKNTLAVVGVRKFNIITNDDDGLQVTQKSSGNFIVVEQAPHVLKAYNVTSAGLVGTQNWAISPQATRSNDEGSVSADGRAASTNRNTPDVPVPPPDQLLLQLLGPTGRPTGAPIPLFTAPDIEASDVTSALAGGKRYVLYVVDNNNTIHLQVVGATGAKIGPSIVLKGSVRRDADDQTLAVDPLGRFFLFTISGAPFGCLNHDVLAYQALNATGHVTGSMKILAKCGAVADDILNIDILKE